MSDLDYKKRAEPSSIVGMDGDESETNFMEVTDNQDAQVTDRVNTSAVYDEITIGTTPVPLRVGAANLDERKFCHITPKDNSIYWGYSNSVTTTTGTRIFKNTTVFFKFGPDVTIWLEANAANKKANIGEGS